MSDIQLIVNDEPLDLKENERIPLTFQSQSFSSIDDKQGNFSRSFVIPATDKNKRLLNYSTDFSYSGRTPYKIIECVLKVNGTEMPSGKLIIENDGLKTTEIRLTYYSGNSNFFQLISKIKLKNICLPLTDHYWSREAIVLYRNWNKMFYPIIDYTGDGYYVKINTETVYFERTLPAIWNYFLFNGIENTTGYEFTGRIVSDDDFRNLFFPTSQSFLRSTDYDVRNTWIAEMNTPESVPSQTLTALRLCDNFSGLNTSYGDFGIGTKPCNNSIVPYKEKAGNPYDRAFMFPDRVRVHMKLTIEFYNDNNASSSDITLYYYDLESGLDKNWYNNDPTISNPLNVNYNGCPLNASSVTTDGNSVYTSDGDGTNDFELGDGNPIALSQNLYTSTINFDIDVIPHNGYKILFDSNMNLDIQSVKWEVTFIRDNSTSSTDREIVQLDWNQNKWSKCWISAATPAPDITVGQFIKSISQLFGCIILTDEDTKKVELFTLAELYENIPSSKDWTDKVVNLEKAFWNTRANGYGKINLFGYQNEDGVSDTIGNYEMTIDDETLPENANTIQSIYSGSEPISALDEKEVPLILRYDAQNKFKGGKQRILYSDILALPGWTLTYSSDPALGVPAVSLVTTNIPMCYFNRSGADRQLGFNEFLFEKYYRFLEYVTTDYKQLTVELLLNPVDILELDFRYPVYLSQFNSYFFIEKIQDWTPGKPCKVQLLKLQ